MSVWIRLAAVISGDQSVVSAVQMASEDVETYFEEHERDLLRWGIEYPEDVTVVVALSDALSAAGELVYIDANADGATVAKALATLPPVADLGVDLSRLRALDTDPAGALESANDLLRPAGAVSIVVDDAADTLAVVIVPVTDLVDILSLAAAVDLQITVPGDSP